MKLTQGPCSHLERRLNCSSINRFFSPMPCPVEVENVCPALPKHFCRLLFFGLVFLQSFVLLAIFAKQGHSHMHTPCSPKVIAESPRFPVTRTNNRTEVYFTFSQRQLSLWSPFNSLHVEPGEPGEPMQTQREKIAIFTDLGSSLLLLAGQLFFIIS